MKFNLYAITLLICSSLIITASTTIAKETNMKNINTYEGERAYYNIKSETIFSGGFFNGVEYVGQSMVHRLGFTNSEKSVVMIPGHGLSSYIYTSTPDGRDGWTTNFANMGYDTFAVDTNNLSVSGFEIKDFGTETQPQFSTWSINKIWKTWGFGNTPGTPYETTQYPVEHIEKLYASFSPMVSKSSSNTENDTTQTDQISKQSSKSAENKSQGGSSRTDITEVENTIALLEKYGPSVLIVHSMGGTIGFEVVRQRPDLVTALVVIEPVGSPTDENDIKEHFINTPYLAVYGDYIDTRGQTGRYNSCKETARIINENSGYGEVITLTDLGFIGNTHLMMQDKNSSDISNIIIEWLSKNVN